MQQSTSLEIPGTANASTLLRYQTAKVEYARILIAAKGAGRAGHEVPDSAGQTLHSIAQTVTDMETRENLPFVATCDALQLDRFQRDALVLSAVPHFEADIRDSIAHFWGQPSRRHVDVAFVVALLCDDPAERIACARRLRDGSLLHVAGLLESMPVAMGHAVNELESELVPTTRLLRLFEGKTGLDPRFRTVAKLLGADEAAVVGVTTPQRFKDIALMVRAGEQIGGTRRADALFGGPPGSGKLRLCRALAAVNGAVSLLVVEAAMLPTEPVRLSKMFEALGHEAELLGARLVLRRVDAFATDVRLAAQLRHSLVMSGVRVWLTSDVDPARVAAPTLGELADLQFSLGYPDLELRREAWIRDLARVGRETSDERDEQLRTLSSDYPLSRAGIEFATRLAAGMSPPSVWEDALSRAAESQMQGQLGRFAKRSRSKARVAEVVLAETTRDQVEELLLALRRRSSVMDRWGVADKHAIGRGIVALFNGPPGTGKTLTASALANEIDIPLYRIDASSIIDRYVGETEKNLSRLFDEAAASRVALLFDEADALFGKRTTDAKDSTDRYANMQTNLLLNLIEDYDGFVVLTTNLKGALDGAFLRRIIYKINFDKPERDQLVALWEYHLPTSIPRAPDVDSEALAEEFDQLTGGDIKNAVLRATLASTGSTVTQSILRRAVLSELRANGGVVRG